jgi:putative membrane protein
MLTKQKNLKALLGTAAFALMFGSSSAYAAGNTGGTSGTTSSGAASGAQMSGAQTSGASASGEKSGAGKISKADEKLMKELAATNMAEMKAAQVALDKSKDDQVQKFAQKMLDDHTKAHEKVRDLAQIKNVDLPNDLDGKHQAEMKKLNNLSGDKFDKTYLERGGVADHRKALQLVERIEKNAKDPQLKALATDMKPTIRDHHELATNLVKDNASTASGSSGGSSGSSAASSGDKNAGSAKVTGRPPANNVELGNKGGSDTSGSSSGGSAGSSGGSSATTGK